MQPPPAAGLARAEELYYGLCAENTEDERLWTALFRIHERAAGALCEPATKARLRAVGEADDWSTGDGSPAPTD